MRLRRLNSLGWGRFQQTGWPPRSVTSHACRSRHGVSIESSLVGDPPTLGVARELHDPGIRDAWLGAMRPSSATKHMLTS